MSVSCKGNTGRVWGGVHFFFITKAHTCSYKMHKWYNESTKISTMHDIGTMLQHPLKAMIVFGSLSVVLAWTMNILEFEKQEVSWALFYSHNIDLNHHKAFCFTYTFVFKILNIWYHLIDFFVKSDCSGIMPTCGGIDCWVSWTVNDLSSATACSYRIDEYLSRYRDEDGEVFSLWTLYLSSSQAMW